MNTYGRPGCVCPPLPLVPLPPPPPSWQPAAPPAASSGSPAAHSSYATLSAAWDTQTPNAERLLLKATKDP